MQSRAGTVASDPSSYDLPDQNSRGILVAVFCQDCHNTQNHLKSLKSLMWLSGQIDQVQTVQWHFEKSASAIHHQLFPHVSSLLRGCSICPGERASVTLLLLCNCLLHLLWAAFYFINTIGTFLKNYIFVDLLKSMQSILIHIFVHITIVF